jgi:hypothetical protein
MDAIESAAAARGQLAIVVTQNQKVDVDEMLTGKPLHVEAVPRHSADALELMVQTKIDLGMAQRSAELDDLFSGVPNPMHDDVAEPTEEEKEVDVIKDEFGRKLTCFSYRDSKDEFGRKLTCFSFLRAFLLLDLCHWILHGLKPQKAFLSAWRPCKDGVLMILSREEGERENKEGGHGDENELDLDETSATAYRLFTLELPNGNPLLRDAAESVALVLDYSAQRKKAMVRNCSSGVAQQYQEHRAALLLAGRDAYKQVVTMRQGPLTKDEKEAAQRASDLASALVARLSGPKKRGKEEEPKQSVRIICFGAVLYICLLLTPIVLTITANNRGEQHTLPQYFTWGPALAPATFHTILVVAYLWWTSRLRDDHQTMMHDMRKTDASSNAETQRKGSDISNTALTEAEKDLEHERYLDRLNNKRAKMWQSEGGRVLRFALFVFVIFSAGIFFSFELGPATPYRPQFVGGSVCDLPVHFLPFA